MFRLVATAAIVFAAYKAGERQAQINAYDYLVRKTSDLGGGVYVNEYLKITPVGIEFDQDINLATPLLFYDAAKFKDMLRRHIPNSNLVIEMASNSLVAQNP